MSPRSRRLFLTIAILAVLGIAVSSISLQHHYAKSKTSYCDFGQSFNCDLVNRSQYSSLAGIPVALIGIAGYLTLLALATLYRDKAETPGMLLLASAVGLAFALYLTYVEGFILQAWCILCLTSMTTIFLITVLSGLLLSHSMRRSGT
jgi:vitamin-K-epoxide reductase (warfarin-sensitive)